MGEMRYYYYIIRFRLEQRGYLLENTTVRDISKGKRVSFMALNQV
jgi:hypothetical protein